MLREMPPKTSLKPATFTPVGFRNKFLGWWPSPGGVVQFLDVTLTMRKTLFIAFFNLMTGVILTGCGRVTSSSIPTFLNSDVMLTDAGRAQGVKLAGGSHAVTADLHSYETERRFVATISSGTSGQLLAAYRREIENLIASTGAEIHESGISGTTNDVQDFSYGYTWGRSDGIVRVFSFVGTNREVQIVTLCYEHRR